MAVHSKAPGRVHAPADEQTPLIFAPDTEVAGEILDQAEEGRPSYVEGAVDDHREAGPNQVISRLRIVLIIFSLWILIFLQASNMSGLTTMQSAIAEDLDAFAETSWFTSAYLIAMSSMSPLAGRLSQLFSPRSCILVAAFLFSVGGLVTSQASTLAVFLIGRAISGAGGAGILILSIILVLELTDKKRRGLFIGLVNAGYTSGVALGALISGALAPITGWRALFAIQLPLGILAGTGVYFSIPSDFVSGPEGSNVRTLGEKLKRIDYLGAVTLSSSIILFLFGLSSAKIQWTPIFVSFVTIGIFVLNELYLASTPIIPITVLSSRGVLLTCFGQLLFMSARWTVLFYSPVYAIAIHGWSLTSAGSILVPSNLGFALGGLLAGGLHIKRGGSFYLPCMVTFACFSLTLFVLSKISNFSSPAIFFIVTAFINGLFTGSALTYTLAHILHLSPASSHFIVTSLLATFRGFAGSFGSAIGGGIFVRLLRSSLEIGFSVEGLEDIVSSGEKEDLIRRLLGSPAFVWSGDLTDAERRIAVAGYETAVKGLFLAAALCAVLGGISQAGAGWRGPAEQKKAVEVIGDDE